MFIDSCLTPKFKAANKTREQLLIESLNAMVKDTRPVLRPKIDLTYIKNISFVS